MRQGNECPRELNRVNQACRCLGLVAAVLLAALPSSYAQSRMFLFYDIDGTVLEHRKEFGGTFSTPYKLFRIQYREFATQEPIRAPEVIEVDQDQYEKLEKLGVFAQGGRPGRLDVTVTTIDGQTLPVGLYQKSTEFGGEFNTYAYFQDPERLLKDFKAAEKKDPSGKWKGFAWDLLMYFLSNPEFASAHAMTARPYSPSFFRYLMQKKYAKTVQDPENQYFLGGEDADRFGREKGIPSMKVEALKEFVSKIQNIPFGLNDKPILNADGDGWIEAFTVVIPENDPLNLVPLVHQLQDFASRKKWSLTPLKFVVFNAGTDEEVARTGIPRWSVVTSSGNLRPATDEEILGHHIRSDQITAEFAAKLRLPSSFNIDNAQARTLCSASLTANEGGKIQ